MSEIVKSILNLLYCLVEYPLISPWVAFWVTVEPHRWWVLQGWVIIR